MPLTNAPDDSEYVEQELRSTDAEFLKHVVEDHGDVLTTYEIERLNEISTRISVVDTVVTEVVDDRLSPDERVAANELLNGPQEGAPSPDGKVTFVSPKVEPERSGGFAPEFFPDRAPS